jgi:hypothetical protein
MASEPVRPDVYTITDARQGLSATQVGRQRRYLISMTIRTVCVLLAIVVPGWPRWVLIAGAIILPYLAVVAANAGHENDEPDPVPTLDPTAHRQLPSGDGRGLPS